MEERILEIDGSRGEGGGQMVRTSVAMATVTGVTTHLTRIRENRPTNGLSKQHCAAVEAVAQMTGSAVEGNTIGSRELTFRPGHEQVYDVNMNIGTAGSVSLVLQAMLLAARNHRQRLNIDISGGTNVMWAPPIDSYQHLLFPLLKKMDIDADVKIISRGFYPQGGGRVIATMNSIKTIKPLDIEDLGELKKIKGVCFSQRLPDWKTDEIIQGCEKALGDRPVEFDVQRTEGDSRGAGIVLVAEYENGMLGSNTLTTRGQTAEKAGEDAAMDLLREMESGATMDVHTADQVLPYMAMAESKSRFSVSRISRHLLSQMDTLESFLDVKFGVERKDDVYQFTVTPGENNEAVYPR